MERASKHMGCCFYRTTADDQGFLLTEEEKAALDAWTERPKLKVTPCVPAYGPESYSIYPDPRSEEVKQAVTGFLEGSGFRETQDDLDYWRKDPRRAEERKLLCLE